MMGCVYLATNTVSKKCYVGKTVESMDIRREWHENCAMNDLFLCPTFHRAIKGYGLAAFCWEVLFVSGDEFTLFLVEKDIIQELSSQIPNGYNMTEGGEGTSGLTWNEESRKKASLSAKKRGPRLQSDDEKAKRSINRMGVCILTDAGRKRIGESNKRRKGEKRSEKALRNMREGCKKRPPVLDETKEKIRQANLGKVMSAETRAKLSLITSSRAGNPKYRHTQATKKKLSDAAKKRSKETSKKIGIASGKTRKGKKRGSYKKKVKEIKNG